MLTTEDVWKVPNQDNAGQAADGGPGFILIDKQVRFVFFFFLLLYFESDRLTISNQF